MSGLVEELSRLISIRSVSGEEHRIIDYLGERLEKLGFSVEEVPVKGSGPSLVARKGDSPLLLYGHVDTVAPTHGWSRDPFRLHVEGEKAYGLGACDMKGGIVAVLRAVEDLNLPVNVAFASDEELFSRGCFALVEGGHLRGVKYVISAEPSSLKLEIGRRGRYAFEVSIRSRSAHASVNSVSPSLACLSKFLSELEELVQGAPEHPILGRESVSVSRVEAGSSFLSTPDVCAVTLNWHCVSKGIGARIRKVEEFLRRLCPHCSFEVRPIERPTPFLEPYCLPSDDPFVCLVKKAYRDALGRDPPVEAGLSVADENCLANVGKLKVVTLGPAGGNEHSADEWVDLTSIEKASAVYRRVMELLARNDKKDIA